MKKILTIIIAFILPSPIATIILRLLGHKVGSKVKIGFSILKVESLDLSDYVRIGHFNLILIPKMVLKDHVSIGYLNILKGPFEVYLARESAIGNKNYLTRGNLGLTYGKSVLRLGELTKITTGHHLDLTQSITFGEFSILAGINSQMWTHGYYHADSGKDRVRIDGSISVGNNVYIGSGCIFNPGVKVSDSIHIGSGSNISKNLENSGMYVGQALRHLKTNINIVKSKLIKVENRTLIETVYTKDKT